MTINHGPAVRLALLACLSIGCQNSNTPGPAPSPIPPGSLILPDAWRMPVDVGGGETDVDWLRFGWDSFISVNWPAGNGWPLEGQGGMPYKGMTIGDPRAAARPAVWQTYLAPGQVFRERGQDPGSWDNPALPFTSTPDPGDPEKRLPVLGGFEEKSIYFFTQNPDFGLALFDLAITPNPVVDQNGNYLLLEVRLNQSEFDYFRRTRYYDTCRQLEDTARGAGSFQVPAGYG